jgi:hypothetical protein
VAADLVEHVVEKGHAGGHLALACAIQAEPHAHIGFAGLAVNLPAAKGFSHAGGGRHDGQGRMKRIMAHGVAPRQAGKGW